MKLVVAIVQDYDLDRLLTEITAAGLRATRIASTGGYLRTGNATVFFGVEDNEVGRTLAILRAVCAARWERSAAAFEPELPELYASGLGGIRIGGGVVFVVAVWRFERVPWAS